MNVTPELWALSVTEDLMTVFLIASVQCRRMSSSLASSNSGATTKRSAAAPSSLTDVGMTGAGAGAAEPPEGGVELGAGSMATADLLKKRSRAFSGAEIVPGANDGSIRACA